MILITTIDELAHIMNGDLVDYLSDLNLISPNKCKSLYSSNYYWF